MNPRDIRGLELGMLRTFDALMRERSVSRAAARLFLSQPAVSASLNRLRETFADPLFTRTAHGVVPTGRALALATPIEKVLADVAALLEADLPFDPATSSRIFRIAGSDHASQLILLALSQRLAACSSAIRLVWEHPGTWPLADRLRKGELDLAVVDSFCATPQVFLGYGTSTLEDVIDETLAKSGRQRLPQIAVSSIGQIVNLLEHSNHGAVIGARVAQAHAGKLHAQPLPFVLPGYKVLVCWDTRANTDAGIDWLKGQILEIVGQG